MNSAINDRTVHSLVKKKTVGQIKKILQNCVNTYKTETCHRTHFFVLCRIVILKKKRDNP